MEEAVLIIGGGVAGLAAALELSGSRAVTVLEAKNRLGGRIHTVPGAGNVPLELGAEFVHGTAPEIADLIRAAALSTHVVPDRHWRVKEGRLVEMPDFWEQLSSVTEEIKPGRDLSFGTFLAGLKKPRESVKLAKDFVEGFHAAPIGQASTQAIRRSEESSEDLNGQRQTRVSSGYSQLVRHLEARCRAQGVTIHTGAEVHSVDWSRRPATVRLNNSRLPELTASRVIITLPIGVLQAGALQLNPKPRAKLEAIHALGPGVVRKVVLQFQSRFWPEENFGFIHCDDEWLPTWWADERGPILTGWAGGEKGERLAGHPSGVVAEHAFKALSRLFGVQVPRIQELLLGVHTHDWWSDPRARGAYSFIPTGANAAPQELARPEAETVFFAGEATDLNYQFGTVHGAIASGLRAARDLMRCAP